MCPSKEVRDQHNIMCSPGNHRRLFIVDVILRHPHFDDTGYDSELLATGQFIWGKDIHTALDMARDTLTPPNVDPSLISFKIEEIKDV